MNETIGAELSPILEEIEDALLSEAVDLAVHSHKDLETNQPEGLEVVAVSDRANPADILLIQKE